MSQVITNAFEQYWQSSLAAEQPVVLDEFILANIPNLDITSPIDPDTGLPPESQIVHRQNVDQRGRINNNAVAYTIVMDTTVGDFSFNAMYLRNKQNGVIGMIVYKGRETKLKTDQSTGQTGNSLVKSMLMGYDQAAEATLTNVDAGTWQIDYAARLRGQDEDLRQLASQLYGHHTFIGDGFKVVQQDGGHQVTPGVAIIGGLRVELKAPEVIYPGSKPIGVWVDVHRAGSLLSEHQNHFTIITSVADLTDHVDSSGYQHFVAKLGTILADSTIEDGRGSAGGGAGSIPDTFALWKRSMAEAGYDLIGQFGTKLTIENANQVVLSKDGKDVYTWRGSLPKNVFDNDDANGDWAVVSNALLRHGLMVSNDEIYGSDVWDGVFHRKDSRFDHQVISLVNRSEYLKKRLGEVSKRDGSISAAFFGVDETGVVPADESLMDALYYSSEHGVEIVVSGLVRLTRTLHQPKNSIVRVDGIVFCEDDSYLTDSLLWSVGGDNDKGCRTQIKRIVLSTSPSTVNWVDRKMRPLHVSTAKVEIGEVFTYGFQLAGPVLGPTGYEISVKKSSSRINRWVPEHKDACGFRNTTTDCEIGEVITAMYPVAPVVGNSNHVASIHCWGLPATAENEFPNQQMITGPTIGTASVVDYIFVDTPDTESYNTEPAGDSGYGFIFNGYESNVSTIVFKIHSQTKKGKVKLGKFIGFSNEIGSLKVPSGSGFHAMPIDYGNDAAKWRNRIDSSNVHSSINIFKYGNELKPAGFNEFSGYMNIEKVGREAIVNIYYQVSSVDVSKNDPFQIPLPAGLSLKTGVTAIVSQRTCISFQLAGDSVGHDFAYLDGSSMIRVAWRKKDVGQMYFASQNQLLPGQIEISIRAPIKDQV